MFWIELFTLLMSSKLIDVCLIRICLISLSLDTITSGRMITTPNLRCTDGAERGGKTLNPRPSEWRYATSSHRPKVEKIVKEVWMGVKWTK